MYIELETENDDDSAVYLTGDFCNWDPANPLFRLEKVGEGKYRIRKELLPEVKDQVEYKYTKGSWARVELDKYGNRIGNRIYRYGDPVTVDRVPCWAGDAIRIPDPESRFREHILEIPQLKRLRKVKVLLPTGYHQSEESYPVIYLLDGQNLFESNAKFSGWNIDQSLVPLESQYGLKVIVVAIDHGDDLRLQEFSPYKPIKGEGKGEGMRFATFIARTLKPFIDQEYRTDPQNTGIGGSSMGGLLSLYAGIMYPEVFKKLMIFSPSLWTSPKIYFDLVEFYRTQVGKIYVYGGQKESKTMEYDLLHLEKTLKSLSQNKFELKLNIDSAGKHSEVFWAKEFPKAMVWLFTEQG